ncbi:MAG TPA: ABC transporter ATP-binding protein [Propionibacteriaceae bacterium]|nr:ABC transporter ATP-binding protein [Propionibacteriaceae bacterium]
MHDFPPDVPDFSASHATDARRGSATRDFSHPDTRSPSRFLRWMLRQQASVLVISSLLGLLQFLPGSIGPYLVGRAIDDGVLPRNFHAVVTWALVLLLLIMLGALAGVLRHTFIVRTWLVALYGIIKLVTRKTTQMGHILPQRTPTGEILSVSSGDSDQFGAINEVLTRAVGAGIAYLLVAGIVLKTSVELGIVVLVAAPILVLVALPLLKPLERRQAIERSTSSKLTSMATDIVAGLRILRGIGGERTFARNYALQSQVVRRSGVAAGTWQAAVDATGVLFAGLFLVSLTWLGAREVAASTLTVGELISFFGYAVFMVWPIQTFFELAQKWVRCLVSARKTIAVLGQETPWRDPSVPLRVPADAAITDLEAGFEAKPGLLTIVVSAVPDDSAALADRLGRYLPTETDPISLDIDENIKGRRARQERARQARERARLAARDRAITDRQWGVQVGAVDLADIPISEVRRHILVSDTSGLVFAGTLQSAVDPHGRLSREQAEKALHTAAAEDVFEAMPGGWQGVIDERGRGLSGGQRQRLILARAIAMDPEILILVEPTSAVDAHTEALIAARLRGHRDGRTTIVMSASPLLLHHADEVAFLVAGQVVDTGTHEDLLSRNAEYRHVVIRSMEEVVDV